MCGLKTIVPTKSPKMSQIHMHLYEPNGFAREIFSALINKASSMDANTFEWKYTFEQNGPSQRLVYVMPVAMVTADPCVQLCTL
jgi:hypothetical protein